MAAGFAPPPDARRARQGSRPASHDHPRRLAALLLAASLPTGQPAQILLHPTSRAPLEFVISPGTQQQVVLTIKAWTMLPGTRERALIGHPPAS